jgi:transcriptional regulator with XRE-family HTH domain
MTSDPVNRSQRRRIGARIRRIRTAAGLRQWQMARLIGSTQPSVCMYEQGVLPDPARLLRIARMGGTTVEWILTGRHWEDGSEEMEPPPPALFALAALFHGLGEEDRGRLMAAMERIRMAVATLESGTSRRLEELGVGEIARKLGALPAADRRALAAALAVQAGVCRAFFARGMRSLKPGPDPRAGGSRPETALRARSIAPVKGPIFRVDPGLLLLEEILGEPALRAEFERTLARLTRKLESRRRAGPSRPARKAAAATGA